MNLRLEVNWRWSRYPVGTVAHASMGAHWTKTDRGWKANGGDTFPTPGGDAVYVTIPKELPLEVLDGYEPNTACIYYRDGSRKLKDWYVGAVAGVDNEETLIRHLHNHLPAAELVGWAVK